MHDLIDGLKKSLRVFNQHLASRTIAGRLAVNNKQIQDLHALGGYHRPGMTKVGRLSLRGKIDGDKVKVYTAASPSQSALIQSLSASKFMTDVRFAPVVVTDGDVIVEKWIDGKPVNKLLSSEQSAAKAKLKDFLAELHAMPLVAVDLDSKSSPFCYINDYLISRLSVFKHLAEVQQFLELFQSQYADYLQQAKVRISHPDLTLRNVIKCHQTGDLVIIDNELVGATAAWYMDYVNASLPLPDDRLQIDRDVIAITTALRDLGYAFDAGNLKMANKILENWLK